MFYEGDLQSGIALAVQQAKSVLCFVTGELPQGKNTLYSKLTEDFQTNRLQAKNGKSLSAMYVVNSDISIMTHAWQEQISGLIKAETIALRLNAGSQEAAFLSSFCLLKGVPAVVLVKYIQSRWLF
jgi:hypothetical protein